MNNFFIFSIQPSDFQINVLLGHMFLPLWLILYTPNPPLPTPQELSVPNGTFLFSSFKKPPYPLVSKNCLSVVSPSHNTVLCLEAGGLSCFGLKKKKRTQRYYTIMLEGKELTFVWEGLTLYTAAWSYHYWAELKVNSLWKKTGRSLRYVTSILRWWRKGFPKVFPIPGVLVNSDSLRGTCVLNKFIKDLVTNSELPVFTALLSPLSLSSHQ